MTSIKFVIGSLVFVQALIIVSAQGKTTLDGIYSEPQAARGEAVYKESCTSCHGEDLSGSGQAPALTGKEFNADWVDLSLGDLFDRTHLSMPADKPGSLTPAQTVDVIAYLLKKGNFPAGTADLPSEAAALKAIKFVNPPAPK
jgi:S-disulfanyl-L-cysteine oxidoreductase SoxD